MLVVLFSYISSADSRRNEGGITVTVSPPTPARPKGGNPGPPNPCARSVMWGGFKASNVPH